MPYRVPTTLGLSESERAELEGWSRRRKTAQALALCVRIVLRAAEGLSNIAIAAELGVSKHTVGKWRERFARSRADGLLDEPRPGAPRRIGDALCVDEAWAAERTEQVQALDRTPPLLPLRPGQAERRGAPTTASATARPRCSPRSTRQLAR
jgi:Winged helix-turn helix